MKNVSRAFLFDCDGVLTDPTEKKITTPGLAKLIAQRIDAGDIVSINTGRSLTWLEEHGVLGEIEKALKDKSKLADFIAIGEKGGTWLTFENNEWVTHVDPDIKMPKNLQTKIKDLIEKEFSDSMFYDESKLTMISTEMHDGFNIPDYTKHQGKLEAQMKKIIEADEFKSLDLAIDPTIIAVDIQNKHVGKHLGARRILDWLAEKGISPDHFITIGDSQSDTEMAQELQTNHSVEFVFVGDPAKLNSDKLTCPVKFTKKRFGEGTDRKSVV